MAQRLDFGPHIRSVLATIKENIYRKNIHRQIFLHYTVSITCTQKIRGLTRVNFLTASGVIDTGVQQMKPYLKG
jgi:hypothetical protein